MNYSLIQVYNEVDDNVDGVWIQDCSGTTLEIAVARAKATERANRNRIKVAVVESLGLLCPNYDYRTGLKRLG